LIKWSTHWQTAFENTPEFFARVALLFSIVIDTAGGHSGGAAV
jgi:hypothetical protein